VVLVSGVERLLCRLAGEMRVEPWYSACCQPTYVILSAMARVKKNIGDIVGDAAKALVKAAAQNPIVAQNVKYVKAVQAGPTAVAKTAAMDLAAGAASAAAGKVVGAVGGRVAKNVAGRVDDYVGDRAYESLSAGLSKASSGGRLYTANTAFGKTLASTKIMNTAQRSAAISGLEKVAANRSNEIGSAVAADVSAAIRSAASNIRAAATPTAVTVKNRKTPKKK
jgi:hypothetical protein